MKEWLIDYVVKKGGPSAIRGAILALTAFIIAHAELLKSVGIIYDGTANKITIDLSQFNMWLVLLLPALGAGIIKILNAHTTDAVQTLTNKVLTSTDTPK